MGVSLESFFNKLANFCINPCDPANFHVYRTHTNKSRGLYNFYPIFHCGLFSNASNITDNLCTKQRNSSKNPRFIIKSGFKSNVGFNGERMVTHILGAYLGCTGSDKMFKNVGVCTLQGGPI